jgi:hypothetical protein
MNYQTLFNLEQTLHNPNTRNSRSELEKLLSDDFVEFGTSGRIYTRKEIITALADEPASKIEAENFEACELALGVVLVTYKTKRIASEGKSIEALRSSVWKLFGEQWKMVFHQGTKLPIHP